MPQKSLVTRCHIAVVRAPKPESPAIEVAFSPPLWLHALIFLPLTAGLALILIQPIKGLVVAFQWQHGMEGFSAAKKLREAELIAAYRAG